MKKILCAIGILMLVVVIACKPAVQSSAISQSSPAITDISQDQTGQDLQSTDDFEQQLHDLDQTDLDELESLQLE